MNSLARDFFLDAGPFFEVRVLEEERAWSWERAKTLCPRLPRGWFELSRCASDVKREFVLDFWLSHFSFQPHVHPMFIDFFTKVEDISVVVTQSAVGEAFVPELVYSLKEDRTFFRGFVGASEGEVREAQSTFSFLLPKDYLAWMKIHNGFGKLSEMGMLPLDELFPLYRSVQMIQLNWKEPLYIRNRRVDPSSFVPFFEAEGLQSFQGFYTDWHTGHEIGNVHVSGMECRISDFDGVHPDTDALAFGSFLDWLAHYLQGMNISF
jgi:hypothetical protein